MTQRTTSQNAALHLFFRLVADALNASGLTVQQALSNRMDIDWNGYMVKELIWRPAQKRFLGKESTASLEKQMEIDQIYEIVNRWLGSLGVENIPFPNDETKISNYPTYASNTITPTR